VNELGLGLLYLAIVGVLAAGSVWVGMLVAPRLGRLLDHDDEGPGDDDD
jgi:hypothetical protein